MSVNPTSTLPSQDYWFTGSRCYFLQDPVRISGTLTPQPIIDLGTVDPISPAIQVTTQQVMDDDGGMSYVVDEEITAVAESYEVKFSNLNMDNLALLFNGQATGPESFTQAATALTLVPHNAYPGRLVKLTDANGNMIFNIGSISAVAIASGTPGSYTAGTSLVLGVDYEIVSLSRGIIRIIPTSTVLTTGPTVIVITYTPVAVTGVRQVTPHVGKCTRRGNALFVWGRCGNRKQTMRSVYAAVTPTASTFQSASASSGSVKFTVLGDPNLTTPMGSLLYFLGDLPPLS